MERERAETSKGQIVDLAQPLVANPSTRMFFLRAWRWIGMEFWVLGSGFWVPGIENRWFSASSRFRLLASTWALGHFSTASGTGRNRIIPGVTGATFTASGYGGACFGNVRESDAVFMEVGVIKWEVYQVSANEHVSSCQGLSIETCIDTRVTALHLTGGGKVEQGYIACFRLRMVISTIS